MKRDAEREPGAGMGWLLSSYTLRRNHRRKMAGRAKNCSGSGGAPENLSLRRKGDPAKLAIANRLHRETVLPTTAIAAKLHMGSPKSARARLREQKFRTGTPSQIGVL